MATFTCAECGFSKQVADEMAGKKARCPKCNAVNEIPLLEENVEPIINEVEPAPAPVAPPENEAASPPANHEAAATQAAEPATAAETVVPPTETAAQASSTASNYAPPAKLPKLSSGWVMGFAASGALLTIGAVLLLLRSVNLSMICFALGTILFIALAVMYAFADTFAKKK